MKDFFENIDLDEISDDDFEKKINSLNQEDLNEALQQSVSSLWGRKKVEYILQCGGDPSELDENEIMLWTKAFAKDDLLFRIYNETVTDLIIWYLYDLDSVFFKEQVSIYVREAVKEYDVLQTKSEMCYKNLGYEPEKIEEEISKKYSEILNSLEEKVNDLYDQEYDKEKRSI